MVSMAPVSSAMAFWALSSTTRFSSARELAWPAASAFCRVMDDISSREADVSSREDACSAEPSARDWLAPDTCWEAWSSSWELRLSPPMILASAALMARDMNQPTTSTRTMVPRAMPRPREVMKVTLPAMSARVSAAKLAAASESRPSIPSSSASMASRSCHSLTMASVPVKNPEARSTRGPAAAIRSWSFREGVRALRLRATVASSFSTSLRWAWKAAWSWLSSRRVKASCRRSRFPRSTCPRPSRVSSLESPSSAMMMAWALLASTLATTFLRMCSTISRERRSWADMLSVITWDCRTTRSKVCRYPARPFSRAEARSPLSPSPDRCSRALARAARVCSAACLVPVRRNLSWEAWAWLMADAIASTPAAC